MMKMITFSLVVLMALPTIAFAQTMAVSADPDGAAGTGPFTQVFDSPVGVGFDLVVWMDTAGEPSSAAEFVVTELLVATPGVFKLGTIKINNTPLDLGDNARGEYLLAFGGCEVPSAELLMVRVTYGDFSGVIGADVVMSLRGLQPGDSQPSTFFGELGFVDCSDQPFVATMGGADGGFTGAGVNFPDGGLVLNPTPLVVPTVDNSVGQLKARF